jgi:hypothetical protein
LFENGTGNKTPFFGIGHAACTFIFGPKSLAVKTILSSLVLFLINNSIGRFHDVFVDRFCSNLKVFHPHNPSEN